MRDYRRESITHFATIKVSDNKSYNSYLVIFPLSLEFMMSFRQFCFKIPRFADERSSDCFAFFSLPDKIMINNQNHKVTRVS